jgi:PAS domain S-box-containing protein
VRFASLLTAAPGVVVRLDRELRYLFVSDAIEGVTGRPACDFVGKTSRELALPKGLQALWEREVEAVFASRRERRFEFSYDAEDGLHWLETHVVPERDGDGAVQAVITNTRDRTETRRAEQEALVRGQRYHELFERALNFIVLIDLHGHLVEVNPAVERALGYGPGTLIGRPLASILAPEERAAAEERMARRLDGTEPGSSFRTVLLALDGVRVPIEANAALIIRDEARYGVLAIARDISDELAATAALAESERLFRGAFEGVAVGMVISDPGATVLRANAAMATMLGYSEGALAGMAIRDFIHADDRAEFADDLRRLCGESSEEPRQIVVERRYVRSDGRTIFARVSISPIRADDRSTRFLVAQVEDVTELRRVATALDETQALHRVVTEVSQDVLAVLDIQGLVRFVSPSVEQTIGYPPEELVGRQVLEFVHEDDHGIAAETIAAALRGERRSVLRIRIVAKDGTVRLWDGTVAPGLWREGSPTVLVANLRDVTAAVDLETQLRQAQKMEAVGRLAGGIAHDFNNLLLVIRGFGDLAREKSESGIDNLVEVDEMLRAAEKATNVTAQLLAFSRRQILNPETLDLGEVVAEMVLLLRRLIGEDVELTTVWPADPMLVLADRTQIQQVITNLTVNARAAMPDGGRLSIEIAPTSDGRYAQLVVRDSGIGMDLETSGRIFEPFFTTKGTGGTGLGLATVHGIVSQSGGTIDVETALGEGTAFTIRFPLVERQAAEPETVAAEAGDGSETVLLVEDELAVRAIVETMLLRRGYRVITAASGAEAIAVAESEPIALLITDVVMPGLSGRETAEAVRAQQAAVSVLFISGYTHDLLEHDEFGPGTAFLPKPFDSEELGRTVRDLLGAHG